jgi:hypothetical protein
MGLAPYRSGSWLGQEQGALFTALMQSGRRLLIGTGEFAPGIRNLFAATGAIFSVRRRISVNTCFLVCTGINSCIAPVITPSTNLISFQCSR